MRVLVIDVGGTHVQVLATGRKAHRQVESGPTLTAEQMVAAVTHLVPDWTYEAVSIGYPGPVVHDRPLHEPYNLGGGWVGFDFRAAFGCPVKLMNDAAMQALGSDNGGRLLFLGLGTGLGSAMVVDGILCRRPIPGRGSRVCAPGTRSRGDERRVYRGPVGWLDTQRPVQVVGERPDVAWAGALGQHACLLGR